MAKATFIVAAIIGLMNAHFQIGSVAVGHSDCIIIMGGHPENTVDKLPVEYYHPDDRVKCNNSHILPSFKLRKYQTPEDTSGCYLTDPQMIVLREDKKHPKESMVFLLQNGTTRQIRIAHRPVIEATVSVSVDSSRCLSCGGYRNKRQHTRTITNQCFEFDPVTTTWTPHSTLQLPAIFGSAVFVSVGGQIYLIGGGTKKNIRYSTNNAALYVSNNSQWKRKTAMTTNRMGYSAAPLSDHEFIVCGGDCGYVSCYGASCEIYDTKKDTWRTAASMSTYRNNFKLINFNDQIYAIGGLGGFRQTPTETVEVYDKTNDKWSMVKSLKFARDSFVAFAVTLPSKTTTTTTHRTTLLTSPPQTPYKVQATTSDYPTAVPINTTATTHSKHQRSTNSQTPSAVTAQLQRSPTATASNTPTTMQIPNATASTTAASFDVRIIWIILLTVGGIIFIILAVVILCVSWKKGYYSKNSKSKKPKHKPIPFDWDDEHGSKIPRDPKMKAEEKSVSQATTTDDSQMTTTTDDDMTMTMTEDERTMRSAASATGGSVTEPTRKKR